MRISTAALGLSLISVPASADAPLARPEVGQPAPAFTLSDLDGKTVSLADHQGKIVVLEWFNPQCPYVVYAHGKGPLATLPRTWADKGVVWLAINSNAPGTQGSDPAVNRERVTEWGLPNPVLVDTDGAVGRIYGAKTTPQVFVIDARGTLVYDGAVDNAPMGTVAGERHEVWLDEVLTDVVNGVQVRRAVSKPYGCSVKYGS
jgi:peroxiredoxin